MNRLDGESNENVYGKLIMSVKGEGINCGVVDTVKCSRLREGGKKLNGNIKNMQC